MWSAILIISIMVGGLGAGYIAGVLSRKKGGNEKEKNQDKL